MKVELDRWFETPLIYFATAFILVVSSGRFFLISRYFNGSAATIRDYFGTFPFIFIILFPALTADCKSNEDTNSAGAWDAVLGKFLSFSSMLFLFLLFTLPVPMSLSGFGPIDAGKIVTEYLGLFLMGSSCIVVGIFSFYIFKTYVSRFLFSLAVLLFFTVINRVAVPSAMPDGVKHVFTYLSFDHHVDNFIHGILNSSDIAFFVLFCFAFLFSTVRLLRIRTWSEIK